MPFPTPDEAPADLATRIGAKSTDGDLVTKLYDTAVELLEDACKVTFRPIPEGTAEEMIVRVVRALWDARRTTHGAQLTTQDGEAGPRAPRDPLAPASALIGRYVVPL